MKPSTKLAFMLWPFVMGGLLAVGVIKCERAWFPVVRDFQVTEVRQESRRVVFSGTMNKVRACEFLGVTAKAGPDFALGVSFDDDISRHTSTRPTGVQTWGPWHIDIAPQDHVPEIELIAMHRCTPFGVTHSHLTTLKLG